MLYLGITKNKDGKTMIIVGKENINNYRLITLKCGLKLEMKDGISRYKQDKSCYDVIREEFNLIGNRDNVYNEFVEILKYRFGIRTNKRSN